MSDGSASALEEIRIDIDKEQAMSNGLTVAQVYQLVATALTDSTNSTTLTFDGEDMTAVIKADSTYNKDNIGSLVVATKTDKNNKETKIKLSDIASIYTAQSPKAINRDNQARTLSVTATVLQGENVSLVSREVEKALEQ